jgi:hypothetical protein
MDRTFAAPHTIEEIVDGVCRFEQHIFEVRATHSAWERLARKVVDQRNEDGQAFFDGRLTLVPQPRIVAQLDSHKVTSAPRHGVGATAVRPPASKHDRIEEFRFLGEYRGDLVVEAHGEPENTLGVILVGEGGLTVAQDDREPLAGHHRLGPADECGHEPMQSGEVQGIVRHRIGRQEGSELAPLIVVERLP